jgi:hypothetical protein
MDSAERSRTCCWRRAIGRLFPLVNPNDGEGSGGRRFGSEIGPGAKIKHTPTETLDSQASMALAIASRMTYNASVRRCLPLLWAAALPFLGGCGKLHPQRCTQTRDCRPGLSCTQDEVCLGAHGKNQGGRCVRPEECSPGLTCDPDGTCQSAQTQVCRQLWTCQKQGHCSGMGRWCVVGSDSDCTRSEACNVEGKCKADTGRCVVGGARVSTDAAAAGDDAGCTAPGARCPSIVSEADCRSSPQCLDNGLCKTENGRCIAASNADCRRSTACATQGLCTVEESRCVVGAADCRRTPECAEVGRCTYQNGWCIAGSGADCAQSRGCHEEKLCFLRGDRCVDASGVDRAAQYCWSAVALDSAPRSHEDCRARFECRAHGRCWRRNRRCVALADDDCRGSSGCADRGLCQYEADACVARQNSDCAASADCRARGQCVVKDGRCMAGGDSDCAHTEMCGLVGWCMAHAGQCVVGSDAACRQSEECRRYGRCSAFHAGTEFGRCEATSDSDCQQSLGCRERGMCRVDGVGSPWMVSSCVKQSSGPTLVVGQPAAREDPEPSIGSRVHYCRDEDPTRSPDAPHLSPAPGVSARMAGWRTISLSPMGIDIAIPNGWPARCPLDRPLHASPNAPADFDTSPDLVYPWRRVLYAALPPDALVALADRFEFGVYALREPIETVLRAIETAARAEIHALACDPHGTAARFQRPWVEWRDAQASSQRLQLSWVFDAGCFDQKVSLDFWIRRIEDVTLVEVIPRE